MKSLKSQILAMSVGLAIAKLDIPGIDEPIHVKQLNAYEREKLEESMTDDKAKYKVRATVFAHTVCDADGNLLFEEKDIDEITKLPMSIVDKVFKESNRFNGITDDNVDDAEKNS